MRRALPLAIAIALVLVATAPTAARERSLFVAGDSLAVGTQPYMPAALAGWRIATDAAVGRHAADGPAVLVRARPLPAVVAVSLGTNDDPALPNAFRASVRATLRVAGQRCVVWADIVRPPAAGVSYKRMNRALRRAARWHANLVVVGWSKLVGRHPEWLAADGVHVDRAGYRARARAYARAIRRCP